MSTPRTLAFEFATGAGEPAGVWIRVSSGAQDEAMQVPDIRRHVESRNYNVRRQYVLHDKSAWKGEQDAKLAEMLADMRAGVIKVLVCWYGDRVERRGVEAMFKLLRLVREAGGRIESVHEPLLGKDDLGGEATTAFGAIMSRLESAKKSDRTLMTFETIRENDGVIGNVPYGFTIVGEKLSKRMIHNDAEAEIIREAARRYLAGEPLQKICDDFNARHIAGPASFRKNVKGIWYPKSLSKILRNEAIIGRRQNAGSEYFRVEPIISVADFNRIDARLSSRAHRKGVLQNKEDQALLASILRCGKCGTPMYRISTRGRRCYYCRGGYGCKMLISEELLDAKVLAYIRDKIAHQTVTVTEVIPGDDHQNEIDLILEEIKDLARDPFADGFFEKVEGKKAEIVVLRETATQETIVPVPVAGAENVREFDRLDKMGKRAIMLKMKVEMWAIKDAAGNVTVSGMPPETLRAS